MPNLGRSHATGIALAEVYALRVLLLNDGIWERRFHAPPRRNDHFIGPEKAISHFSPVTTLYSFSHLFNRKSILTLTLPTLLTLLAINVVSK